MVRLDRRLLLLYQFCQLQKFRGHETDDEQLHVVHLCSRHVVPPEPTADVPALVEHGPTRTACTEHNDATETRKWTFALTLLSEIF